MFYAPIGVPVLDTAKEVSNGFHRLSPKRVVRDGLDLTLSGLNNISDLLVSFAYILTLATHIECGVHSVGIGRDRHRSCGRMSVDPHGRAIRLRKRVKRWQLYFNRCGDRRCLLHNEKFLARIDESIAEIGVRMRPGFPDAENCRSIKVE